MFAHESGLNARKSAAMTRAIAALVALEMGVDASSGGIGAALLTFYRSGKKIILDNVVRFDPEAMRRVTTDFEDVRKAVRAG